MSGGTAGQTAGVEITEFIDADEFAPLAEPAIAAEPVLHSVLASVVDTVRRRPEAYPRHWFYLIRRRGLPDRVAHHTPDFPLHIPLPDEPVARALAEFVHAAGHTVHGAGGALQSATAFATRWQEWRGQPWEVGMRLGLYELTRHPIVPFEVPGAARPATLDDLDLVNEWSGAFLREALRREPDPSATFARTIEAGRVMLWCDPDPVAMAAANLPQAGVVRIGGVYTPPDRRGRGYGSGATAAVSAARLAEGLRCMLYTDLANPISNGIYQAMGYRKLGETADLRIG